MRKINNTKEFILNNETLKELCKDKKVKYCIEKMNHHKNGKSLSKQVRNLKRYIKRNYDCNQVSFDWEILEFKYVNDTVYRQVIKLPVFCGCCHEFYYKEDMYDKKVCKGCYEDAFAIPVCCRCGGYIGLECNCD